MTFRFKVFGWAFLLMLLTLIVILCPIYLIVTFESLEYGQRVFLMLFGWVLYLAVLVILCAIILTEFNHLIISEDKIEFKNLITSRCTAYYKKDLKGYTIEYTKGYLSINLISNKNKKLKSIREIYYGDLANIIKLLQLKPLN